MQIEIASFEDSSRATLRCQLCDFTEIVTDLVYAHAPLCLAACPRCDHRWTSVIAAGLSARGPGLTRPRRVEQRAVA
jgi:uncharacterized paraquat-inducible protein A